MPDFYPLLRRAVDGLDDRSPAGRQIVYHRARTAFAKASAAGAMTEGEMGAHRAELDEDIDRLETEFAVSDEFAVAIQAMLPHAGLFAEAVDHPAPTEAVAPAPTRGQSPRQLAMNTVAGAAGNIVKIGIQLVMLPVMAHLLGPAEFGLYALALPTVSFFLVLADGGMGLSLAREDENASVVWSTAFWVLLATGLVLAAIVTGWGVVLAGLAGEPRLIGIMAFLSTSFPLITLAVLPSARLTRRGNLVIYAVTDVASTSVGAAVAVGLAASGAGAWSLAAQYVCGFLIRSLILNAVAFARPTRAFDLATLRPHLSTGSSVLGSRLADFASRLVENLVFGRTFGAAALGTYTFANQSSRFLCEAASNPLWAALYAQALHEDRHAIAALHGKLSRLLALVLFPAALLLAASGPQLVEVFLGEKWATAGHFLQILVPFYALNVVGSLSSAILLAHGRNATTFWIMSGNSIGRILAVCLGPWIGAIGVAVGVSLSNVCYAVAMLVAPSRTTGSSPWRLIGGLVRPAAASLLGASLCLGFINSRPASLTWMLISLLLGAAAYLMAMVLLEGDGLRSDLQAILDMARRRPAKPAKES